MSDTQLDLFVTWRITGMERYCGLVHPKMKMESLRADTDRRAIGSVIKCML